MLNKLEKKGVEGMGIGPSVVTAERLMCEGCDFLVVRQMGGTVLYPKQVVVFYCSHPDLAGIGFIRKGRAYTPKWCPAMRALREEILGPE